MSLAPIAACNALADMPAGTASITAAAEVIETVLGSAFAVGSGVEPAVAHLTHGRAACWRYGEPPTAARRLRVGWGRSGGGPQSQRGQLRRCGRIGGAAVVDRTRLGQDADMRNYFLCNGRQ